MICETCKGKSFSEPTSSTPSVISVADTRYSGGGYLEFNGERISWGALVEGPSVWQHNRSQLSKRIRRQRLELRRLNDNIRQHSGPSAQRERAIAMADRMRALSAEVEELKFARWGPRALIVILVIALIIAL